MNTGFAHGLTALIEALLLLLQSVFICVHPCPTI